MTVEIVIQPNKNTQPPNNPRLVRRANDCSILFIILGGLIYLSICFTTTFLAISKDVSGSGIGWDVITNGLLLRTFSNLNINVYLHPQFAKHILVPINSNTNEHGIPCQLLPFYNQLSFDNSYTNETFAYNMQTSYQSLTITKTCIAQPIQQEFMLNISVYTVYSHIDIATMIGYILMPNSVLQNDIWYADVVFLGNITQTKNTELYDRIDQTVTSTTFPNKYPADLQNNSYTSYLRAYNTNDSAIPIYEDNTYYDVWSDDGDLSFIDPYAEVRKNMLIVTLVFWLTPILCLVLCCSS